MADLTFPVTASDFATLAEAGMTVVYYEGERPDSTWSKWGHRNGIPVWRTIMSVEDALRWESERYSGD